MKRIKTMFILFSLLVSISACANNGKDDNTTQNEKKSMKTIHLTKTEFLNKVYDYENNSGIWKYEGDRPAVVDFYATWCGPCKALSPILEELAAEYDGKIYIYKIDIDKERELAEAFNVQSIPTLLFIPQNGKPVITQGAMPKNELKKMIDQHLLGVK